VCIEDCAEQPYAAETDNDVTGSIVPSFTAQRAELLAVLQPLAPEAWSRTALVTEAGKPRERNVQTYAQWLANHEQSHLRQIERIVNSLRIERHIATRRRKEQMTTNLDTRHIPKPPSSVIHWLLDSDPSIRWHVLRDLTDAADAEVVAERARVATEGWGADLLAHQGADGFWGVGAANPEWVTLQTLLLLRDMGLDPVSEQARRAVNRVRDNVRWQGVLPQDAGWHDRPLFAGEVEPCINGRVVAAGAYFGQDVQGIVERLLGEQMADGGWNCEQERGSTRGSFHTTICVLEGLREYERAMGGSPAVTTARERGQNYLLERHLLRRLLSGALIEQAWTQFSFPTGYHYDVLRGLEYLRGAGVRPDARMAEAIELVASKRDASGRWPLEHAHPDQLDAEPGVEEGRPSRWNTLRASRVLDWYATGA